MIFELFTIGYKYGSINIMEENDCSSITEEIGGKKLKGITVSSYEEFKQKIDELNSNIGKQRKKRPHTVYSDPVFRGQKNGSWKLKSTLERRIENSEFPYLDYLRIMKNVQKEFQNIARKTWNLEDKEEEHNFIAYLRHYGFTSPLLDWSTSMDVASFFAFQFCSDEEYVAVYLFIENIGIARSYWVGDPNIFKIAPDIKDNVRHKKQMSQYTMSIKTIEGASIFCNHEEAMEKGMDIPEKLFEYYSSSPNKSQDLRDRIFLVEKVQKYLIPSSERVTVLDELKKKGIDKNSLFQDGISLSPEEKKIIKDLDRREFPS
jgi:hypothetical protein